MNVAVRRTIALSEANHPVADPALAQAAIDVAAPILAGFEFVGVVTNVFTAGHLAVSAAVL